MNLAVITARGGSKRIPRKNIKNFMGKPMLVYAIEAAKNSGIFDEIMVSTDDNEIVEIALKNGAKVPFLRSEKTANDFATTMDVLTEVIDNYGKISKYFDNLCCIYPCVPFLNGEVLKHAYKSFLEKNSNLLVPVVKFSYPIQRAFKINIEGYLEYVQQKYSTTRSQDLEPSYHDVGMFYFCKLPFSSNMKAVPYIMDDSVIQDIDTVDDWKMAEIKYKILKEKSRQD